MTAIETLIASIDQRVRQLNEEISTLTTARAALASRESRAIMRRRPKAASTATKKDGRGTPAAIEPASVSATAREASPATRQRSRVPVNRRRRQKRGTVKTLPAEQLETLLSESEGMTTAALAERANGNRDQILTLLRDLETSGRIRRTGQRRSTRWYVISDEERIQKRAAELAARRKTAV
jgi:hypothetical protein